MAHEHNLPIDLILISLVWFDKVRGIYAEYPEHIDWIFGTAIPRFNEWGYKVEVLYSEHDYLDSFYWVTTKSKYPERNGKLRGWLLAGLCVMNSEKTAPLKKRKRQLGKDNKEYIGIAVDEPVRLERMHKKAQMLYHCLKNTDIPKQWLLKSARNTVCFRLYMKCLRAVVVGFAQIRR